MISVLLVTFAMGVSLWRPTIPCPYKPLVSKGEVVHMFTESWRVDRGWWQCTRRGVWIRWRAG